MGQAVAAQSTKPATTATVTINATPNQVDVWPGDVFPFLSAVLLSASSVCRIVDPSLCSWKVICFGATLQLLSIPERRM